MANRYKIHMVLEVEIAAPVDRATLTRMLAAAANARINNMLGVPHVPIPGFVVTLLDGDSHVETIGG